jgi:thiamine biosynthesis lipoprotein
MGTTYHVKLVGAAAADAAAIRAEIEAVLADVDVRLSTYRRDSEVSRFNRAPAGKWFAVSPATAEIVATALAISRQTGGALDVTVGPLVRLWHFGPNAITESKSTADLAPPDEAALQAARKLVGYEKLDVRRDPPALRKQVDGLEIDLSAIGEGDAIDRVAAAIAKRGIKDHLVELGGEIRARGSGPNGKSWRVAVEQPPAVRTPTERHEIETAVPLANAAIATSGDYRRFFEQGGHRYSHVIDPSTGRPVDHALAAVTVVADNAITADAWDTALLVLGEKRGYDCAVQHEIAALLISRDGGELVTQATPAWRKRFAPAVGSAKE